MSTATSLPVVSPAEKIATVNFWKQHAEQLRDSKLVSDLGLQWISICTSSTDNIGYGGEGQIRPGDLGKWDLYGLLEMSCNFQPAELLLLADISPSEFENEKKRTEMSDYGLDLDKPQDVLEFEQLRRLSKMSPEERDVEIVRLTQLLAVATRA
jgi:hypothetical protein